MKEYVLATLNPPRIFNFYHTEASALAHMARAASTAAIFGPEPYTAMTYEAYKTAERHFYLDTPAQEIDENAYDYALNVLPPLHYGRHNGVVGFLMSEFWSGPYTHQYAAAGGRYYCKMVDATDPTT